MMEEKQALSCLSALAHETRLAVFRLLVQQGPEGTAAGEIALIPTPIDQNPCAHDRIPMDMMLHGWLRSLFQASRNDRRYRRG
jgi:hypothetical protein